jgi:hypothetical protein
MVSETSIIFVVQIAYDVMKFLNQVDICSRDSDQVKAWTAVGSVLECPQHPDLPWTLPPFCSVNTSDSFLGCVAVHSSQPHANVKNAWSVTSVTSYVIMITAGTCLRLGLCIPAGFAVVWSSHSQDLITLNGNIILTCYARTAQ